MPYRVASAEECPALAALFAQLWPRHKRWTVSVLVQNAPAVAFWRAMGYTDYELTFNHAPGVTDTEPRHGADGLQRPLRNRRRGLGRPSFG